jgi:hypothetical protein
MSQTQKEVVDSWLPAPLLHEHPTTVTLDNALVIPPIRDKGGGDESMTEAWMVMTKRRPVRTVRG